MAKAIKTTQKPSTASALMKRDPTMEEVRVLVSSHGWTTIFEPTVQGLIVKRLNDLATPSNKRPEGEPDDVLRGRVLEARYILTLFKTKLAEYDTNRFREAQEQTEVPAAGSPYAPDDPEREGVE